MRNDMSSTLQVHYGVLQRSVLGLILFNIYVNNLSEEIKDCFLIQYADNTQYLQTGTIGRLPQLIYSTEQTLTKIKHVLLQQKWFRVELHENPVHIYRL